MSFTQVCMLLLWILLTANGLNFCPPDPDACRTVTQLISSKGYQVQEHRVTTDDRYILTLQRILPRSVKTLPCKVVFLQHGFADSAATWVMNRANQSLGFILADAGYDVWLANSRGNTYSSSHVSLTVSNPAFWQWSWNEMQKYDLPAMINYVLNTTSEVQLNYIGHSQGTLIGFTGFASNRTLATKIRKFIALAPVATVTHVLGSTKVLNVTIVDCKILPAWYGSKGFLPNTDANRFFAKTVCAPTLLGARICQANAFQLAGPADPGPNFPECNTTRFQVIYAQYPAGTSTQNAQHFCQMARSKKATIYAFDYGSAQLNKQYYNQTTPPEYDPSSMTVPTYLFSGSNDYLASPQDVAWIASKLPNIVQQEVMSGWNHMDFVWGVIQAPTLYSRIATILAS